MNRAGVLGILTIVAAVASLLEPQAASGRPQYRARLVEVYKETKIADAVSEANCNACHYGTSKKNRNDYGHALSKHLTKDVYMQLRTDKKSLDAKITECLKAVLSEKSASGKTFGELIEAGQLPGTTPQD